MSETLRATSSRTATAATPSAAGTISVPGRSSRTFAGVDDDAARSLGRANAVFVNGFVFDEMHPDAVGSAVAIAKANGAGVFFDPGPRAFTFVRDPERREALDTILGAVADVVLATLEEAAALVDSDAGARGFDATGDDAVGGHLGSVPRTRTRRVAAPRATGVRGAVGGDKMRAGRASIFTRRGDQVPVGAPRVDVGDTVHAATPAAAAAIVLGYAKIAAARKNCSTRPAGKIAYLPNAVLAALMEETLTLATAVGAATATRAGAGRNVATVDAVEKLPRGVRGGGGGVRRVRYQPGRGETREGHARREPEKWMRKALTWKGKERRGERREGGGGTRGVSTRVSHRWMRLGTVWMRRATVEKKISAPKSAQFARRLASPSGTVETPVVPRARARARVGSGRVCVSAWRRRFFPRADARAVFLAPPGARFAGTR